MANQKRILIIAKPNLSRSLESLLRRDEWRVYRSPDVVSLEDAMSSVRPHILVVGLDTPWFDETALIRLVSATDWKVPVLAITSLVVTPVDGPITFFPASASISEIASEIDKLVDHQDLVPAYISRRLMGRRSANLSILCP